MNQPLAYRMRPTTIEEVVGQQHLVGEGKIIWRMVEAKRLSSMILYGPPGIGKTSVRAPLLALQNMLSESLMQPLIQKKIYKLWQKKPK